MSFPFDLSSNFLPPNDSIDMSQLPISLSPAPFPFMLPPTLNFDSGMDSLNALNMFLNLPFSSLGTPARKERKKRGRDDFCKLCMKKIAEEGRRSQGPSRHVLQCHMDIPKFFCPHCEFASKYDKAHISTHMRCMHPGMGGEVRIANDAVFLAKFKKIRDRCFGPGEEVKNESVSPSSETTSLLPFSIDSLLAPQSSIQELTPPETPPPSLDAPTLLSLLLSTSQDSM